MDGTTSMGFWDIFNEILFGRKGNRTAIDPVVQDIVDKEVDKLLKGNIESLINATDVGQGVIVFHTEALRSFWEKYDKHYHNNGVVPQYRHGQTVNEKQMGMLRKIAHPLIYELEKPWVNPDGTETDYTKMFEVLRRHEAKRKGDSSAIKYATDHALLRNQLEIYPSGIFSSHMFAAETKYQIGRIIGQYPHLHISLGRS